MAAVQTLAPANGGAPEPAERDGCALSRGERLQPHGSSEPAFAVQRLERCLAARFSGLPQSLQGDILVAIPAGQNLDSILAMAVMVVAALFFIWGRMTVARGPRFRYVNVVFPLHGKPRRRPRFRGHKTLPKKIRIAQVSDLHIGRAIKKPYVARVVEMLNSQNADIVCALRAISVTATSNTCSKILRHSLKSNRSMARITFPATTNITGACKMAERVQAARL
jgi:hypothetical protein